jgi:hypothetical protein
MNRLLTGILLVMLVVMPPAGPVVASGLSILSAADSERSRSGLPEETSEERLEESEEERGAEAGGGDSLLLCSGRRFAIEAGSDCAPDEHSLIGPSSGPVHAIRGPPLP